MKCPHCLIEIHSNVERIYIGEDSDGNWAIFKFKCPNPACNKFIFYLANGAWNGYSIINMKREILVWPRAFSRTPLSPEVPSEYSNEYNEASVILSDSPKASAALSRRCLQRLLRDVQKVKPGDLSNEIQQLIDSKTLPSHLVDSIDAIRNIGNFGAHPIKSKQSGEIFDVEPGEAEWNLDVLESLFDHYFIQPSLIKKKRDQLSAKLAEAGKPPMKC